MEKLSKSVCALVVGDRLWTATDETREVKSLSMSDRVYVVFTNGKICSFPHSWVVETVK